VRVRVAPELFQKLSMYLGEGMKYTINEAESEDVNGWREVCILFENIFGARERILSFGRAVEVLEPEVLKLSVIDFARQILNFYQVKLTT
jgi:predicted DNA-binding transcriptional regulator YafY